MRVKIPCLTSGSERVPQRGEGVDEMITRTRTDSSNDNEDEDYPPPPRSAPGPASHWGSAPLRWHRSRFTASSKDHLRPPVSGGQSVTTAKRYNHILHLRQSAGAVVGLFSFVERTQQRPHDIPFVFSDAARSAPTGIPPTSLRTLVVTKFATPSAPA